MKDGWYRAASTYLIAYKGGVPLLWFEQSAGNNMGNPTPDFESRDAKSTLKSGSPTGVGTYQKTAFTRYPEFEQAERWQFPLTPFVDDWLDELVVRL